jgi:hypothetical protein
VNERRPGRSCNEAAHADNGEPDRAFAACIREEQELLMRVAELHRWSSASPQVESVRRTIGAQFLEGAITPRKVLERYAEPEAR